MERHANLLLSRKYPVERYGLYIVRRIVEGHGGTVAVDSIVGKGSSFHVRLPWDGG